MSEALDRACLAADQIPNIWSQSTAGEQLSVVRRAQGVSQRQLADLAGVDQSRISRLEAGHDAKWDVWRRLFAALGFEAILAPRPSSDEVEAFLKEEMLKRMERRAAGRIARWPRRY